MINTVILDLDGPILDGKFRHYQCYWDILREHGFTPIPIDAYWEMKRQRINRHAQLSISGAGDIYEVFLDEWLNRIEEKKYLSLDRLQPGVFSKLSQWRDSCIRMILVTMRNNSEHVRWQLDINNLAPLFDEVLVVGVKKGTLGKAEKVRPLLASTTSVAWIGDTEVDFKAARQLGVTACLVSSGLRTMNYLASLAPDFLFLNVASITLSEMS